MVDDSQAMVASLCRLLARHSQVEVIGTASNGGDAVELGIKTRPDLILMDIQMPCLNGITACRTIREWAPEIHVILITGHGDTWATVAASAGASAVVSKAKLPAELPQLLAKLFP